MTAKEMFEKLGYEFCEIDDEIKGNVFYYLKATHYPNKIDTKTINFRKITFFLNGFEIEEWLTDAYINRIKNIDNQFIDFKLLQAINKQISELEWEK